MKNKSALFELRVTIILTSGALTLTTNSLKKICLNVMTMFNEWEIQYKK